MAQHFTNEEDSSKDVKDKEELMSSNAGIISGATDYQTAIECLVDNMN
ncbi:MAG: hypothetical protein GX225_02660 [Clostridiales bacterium]|nr:hypothetical protein [Clostridiales bacterium]